MQFKCLTVLFFLVATVGFSAGQTKPLSAPERRVTKSIGTKDAQNASTAQQGQNPATNQVPFVQQPNTPELKTAEKQDEKQGDESMKIQRKLAIFTGLLVVVGFLQVVALAWQAWVFLRTLGDTHDLAQQAVRQADLTQAQLQLSHRPWVSADVAVASNLIFDERGAVLMLNITMRNFGHSVAKYASLWTEFVVAGVHDLNQSHERLCNIMKQPVNEKSDYGWLLFPDQLVIEPRPLIANLKDIEQALKSGHFKDVGAVGLHLIGCVDYQSSFDPKKRHQTRFVYLVGRIDQQRNTVMGTFDPHNKFYVKIVLTPTMHGASAD